MEKQNKVVFLNVEIDFRTTHNIAIGKLMGCINIGGITLKVEDREYMLDVVETIFTNPVGGGTRVTCKLDTFENTLEVFEDCKFDVTDLDFMVRKFDTAEMYLTFEDDAVEDYESDVESITLSYKIDDCTYVLELEPETFSIID